MSGARRWGIAQVLMALVLAALAPLIALEVYRGVQDVRRSRDAVTTRAVNQATEEAGTMDDFLRFTERYLATLAADPGVRGLNGAWATPLFRDVRDLNPNYENVFLLDLSGRQLASTESLIDDPEIAQQPYFREALATGRMALSDVVIWPGSGRSVVVLAYPVAERTGSAIGVLCVALNLTRLSTVIGYVGLPSGSVVLALQRDGRVIAANDRSEQWVGRTLASSPVFPHISTQISGSAGGEMPDSVNRVVGFQRIQRAPWLILAAIPQAEVDATLRAAVWRVAQQAAIATLATVIITWIVLRRLVRPIRSLAEGSRAFAAGHLSRRIPVTRHDELGDLAVALNSMARALDRRLQEETAHAEALRALNQLQTEFVATASHELRTPVTAIRSYTEALLREEITDEATRRECLEGIDRGAERLTRLVRTLLDVSRIDSGMVAFELAPADVIDVMQSACAQAGAEHDARITFSAEPHLPPVLADADRLEDVLANLIGNAQKFSPAGAPIEMTARCHDDEVRITVRDHGPGIATAEQARIFDRFYQVERGAGRRAGGAGLGLYIVRGYVGAMDGRIWVESEEGVGSAFVVALPIAQGDATPAVEDRQDARIAGPAGR